MPTPAQLEATRLYLTGSTIGWALGFGPKAPSELWEIKTQGRQVEETDEMWAGTEIEPFTRKLAERYLRRELVIDDLVLRAFGDTVHHQMFANWWAVHPDSMAYGNLRVCVQLKNHSPRVFKQSYKGKPTDGDDNDKVPTAYQMQVLWERSALLSWMYQPLAGQQWKFYLGAYFGGVDLKLYRIGPNARLLDQMIEKGYAFWKQSLDPNGPQEAPSDKFWARNRDRLKTEEEARPIRPISATKAEIAKQPVVSLGGLA